jgi:hypothetical protein
MRGPLLIASICFAIATQAQHELSPDSIAAGLTGCWFAGDGGMKGYYCFSNAGTVLVRQSGAGRKEVEGQWEVDKKGQVTIVSGKSKTRYLVERLEADGFILVTPKDGVRLEGHKERPKGWK